MSDNPMSVGHPGEGVPFHVYDGCDVSLTRRDSKMRNLACRNSVFW